MVSARFPLQDRTAVVLGAHGLVGLELCRALDSAGARVIEAGIEIAVEEVGSVDVLVVHAVSSPFVERCCESIATAMARRGRGSIVFVEDVGEDEATASRCSAMAARWEPRGIRVNSLTHRALERGPDPHFVENMGDAGSTSPDERRQEYGAALVFLASDASSHITGFQVVADGSWVQPNP
jgi:NAD(P)-dependent dehydrogenase (short-subunit alcohol dehydrogenase family)